MRISDLALRLLGATSGEQIIKAAAAASGAITLPAGTTDFSATGGTSQVVKQTTAGGAFTVGQLAAADVTGALTAPVVVANGGTGATTLAVPALPFSPTGGLIFCHGTGALTAATNWGQFDQYGLYAAGITGNAPYIEMGSCSNTLAAPAATALNQILGAFYFDGYGTAWNAGSRAQMLARANELWTASAQGTRFEWLATPTGGTATGTKMTLDGSGNLTVTGGISATGPVSTLGTGAQIAMADTVSGAGWIMYSQSGSLQFGDSGGSKMTLNGSGYINAAARYCRPGTAGPSGANLFNINYTSGAQLWIDVTNLGTITVTSDYRTKENVAELPSMWDRIKTLRPISYTRKDHEELLSRADPAERWGFIAHELQEDLIQTAASGYKDAPNEVQSPDVMTLLATVTKALQEAMVRIEVLEARGASGG